MNSLRSTAEVSRNGWAEALSARASEAAKFDPAYFHSNESWRKVPVPEGPFALKRPTNGTSEERQKLAAVTDEAVIGTISTYLEGWIETNRSEYFSMLSLVAAREGVFLNAGLESRDAISKVLHTDHENGFSLTVLYLPPQSELSVTEQFLSSDESVPIAGSFTLAFLSPGSSLKYSAIRSDSSRQFAHHRFEAVQMEGSTLETTLVHLDGGCVKNLFTSHLRESGAKFSHRSLSLLSDRSFHNIEVVANHEADSTESSILHRALVNGQGHSVFHGRLDVSPGIDDVNGSQINHNILLDPRARAQTIPALVTRSDGVACEHGATVGEIDEEALFFLQARGFEESEAKSLLLKAFITDVLGTLPDEIVEPFDPQIGHFLSENAASEG